VFHVDILYKNKDIKYLTAHIPQNPNLVQGFKFYGQEIIYYCQMVSGAFRLKVLLLSCCCGCIFCCHNAPLFEVSKANHNKNGPGNGK